MTRRRVRGNAISRLSWSRIVISSDISGRVYDRVPVGVVIVADFAPPMKSEIARLISRIMRTWYGTPAMPPLKEQAGAFRKPKRVCQSYEIGNTYSKPAATP